MMIGIKIKYKILTTKKKKKKNNKMKKKNAKIVKYLKIKLKIKVIIKNRFLMS